MKQREHWGSRLGFILAAAGSAIGLGSLWRFPYVAGENGGGFFVLFYLLFTFLLGIPLFIAESLMGRRAQRGAVGTYSDLSPYARNWKLVGWLGVFSCFTILSFYSVISGWAFHYAWMSLNHFTEGRSPDDILAIFNTMASSGDINIVGHFVFMLLTAGAVYGGVRKGVEHWSRILMPLLLVFLVALFLYGTTLEGFGKAFHFIFYPDFSEINPSSLLKALGMALFTLSVGIGIILTYGSYLKKTDDIPKTTFMVQGMNIVITLMASMIIFPIIFTFDMQPEQGPGLVFKTLPVLFSQLPGAMALSSIFFILMVFTALTSTISLMECLVANFMEILDWSRQKAAIVVGIACFLFGIPSALSGSDIIFSNWQSMYGKSFLNTMVELSDWQFPVTGFLTALFCGWVLDKKILREEFCRGSRFTWLFLPWLFLLRWVVPLAILIIMLQQGGLLNIDSLWQSAQTQ